MLDRRDYLEMILFFISGLLAVTLLMSGCQEDEEQRKVCMFVCKGLRVVDSTSDTCSCELAPTTIKTVRVR